VGSIVVAVIIALVWYKVHQSSRTPVGFVENVTESTGQSGLGYDAPEKTINSNYGIGRGQLVSEQIPSGRIQYPE